ncbi:MAG: T9SS C-terminal target domain-containing protein [Flavobacteriia bacterium]|nr:T9SS C-terminal target domain-containing protein [Flavobacteriia bacterium]
MKRFVSIALFFSMFVVFGQKNPRLMPSNALAPFANATTAKPEATDKTLGVVLWSDNFDSTSHWTINNSGQVGIDFGWNINNVSDGWWSANGITSTGGGKYAELVNGDPTVNPGTQATNVTYTLTTANPINITALGGTNQVSLEFQQYGARFNDLQEIQISLNGSTWTTVGNNLDKSVLSQSGGSAYPNPDLKVINLATILPANPGNVWIRFSWTTNYPAQAANPNVWITYGWYIDNVKIKTNPTNDLSVTSKYWGTAGLNYYQIPTTQTAPIDFQIKAFNGGVNPQPGVKLNVNVNSGAFTSNSPTVTVPSLDTATLTVTNPYTPPALGNYTVVQTLMADSTDDVPANNSIPNVSFAVTNYTYARDNGTPAGSTNNDPDGFEVGNLYDIFHQQVLKGIDVRMLGGANGTAVGTEMFVKLYSIDTVTGDFVFESESDPVIVAAGDLGVNRMIALNVPVTVQPNVTYLAVAGSAGQGLKVVNAGTSAVQTSFFLDYSNQTWYYQTSTPWVRLNFNPSIGVEENAAAIAALVYPNPAHETLTIKADFKGATSAQGAIYNHLGAMVKGIQFAATNGIQNQQVAIEDLAPGMYVVKLQSESGVITKHFVKK